MELIKGIRNREHEHQVVKMMKGIRTIPLDPAITARAMGILQRYHLSHGLAILDGLIAATTIETCFSLFTHNVKDFRFIEELQLYQF